MMSFDLHAAAKPTFALTHARGSADVSPVAVMSQSERN